MFILFMFQVIGWAQKVMDREFLVTGQLCGKDLTTTRSPQKYNLTTLDAILGLD